MTDIASDLKERFDWAMYQSQEAYVVLPDGRPFERSDRGEYAIGVFKDLYDTCRRNAAPSDRRDGKSSGLLRRKSSKKL
jgi:hypothetical protein